MFNEKLAQSVQRDYHQAADNHRLIKETDSKASRLNPLKQVAMLSALIVALNFFI